MIVVKILLEYMVEVEQIYQLLQKSDPVISTTIDKYVYLIINRPFKNEFILKYSKTKK